MHRNKHGPGSDGGGLVARLLECHTRIREMLATGSAMTGLASEEETTAVAQRLGRYFTRGLPLHTRDEEESILPRLAAPGLGAALERMHREHVEHESLVQKVVASCRALVEAPSRWQELRTAIAVAVDALTPTMTAHLLEEERDVFPHVERLDAAVQSRILGEIDARRAGPR